MNIQEKKDAQLTARINTIATEAGNACFCSEQRFPLDGILLAEFSLEEIKAVTAIVGLSHDYDSDFELVHFGGCWIPQIKPERVYDRNCCKGGRGGILKLAEAMKAVLAIRQHIEVWIW